MTNDPTRLREPPRDRFETQVRLVSLNQAFEELPHESIERQGHIQKALFRHGPTTTAIFLFEADSRLREHAMDGEAIIHVLEGRVTIQAEGQFHELAPNDLMLLKPRVQHDIEASETTRLLMHVVLEEA